MRPIGLPAQRFHQQDIRTVQALAYHPFPSRHHWVQSGPTRFSRLPHASRSLRTHAKSMTEESSILQGNSRHRNRGQTGPLQMADGACECWIVLRCGRIWDMVSDGSVSISSEAITLKYVYFECSTNFSRDLRSS